MLAILGVSSMVLDDPFFMYVLYNFVRLRIKTVVLSHWFFNDQHFCARYMNSRHYLFPMSLVRKTY